MEEAIEVSDKTVDDAIVKALQQFGVGRDQVEITVISEGKGGIFGIGAEEAKIKVRRLTSAGQSSLNVSNIAKEVTETVLSKMGVSATVVPYTPELAATEEGEKAAIALDIKGEDLGILIGRRGQTLVCLQYIVRLITSQKVKSWVPIIIDVEGYKQRRDEGLKAMAFQIAERVKSKGTPFKLEPMPAYERRIIHMTLANSPDVTTQSIGEGESRRVTIIPKK